MSVARIPRGKAWAAAISAVLVTLTLPTVTATPAAATTTAYDSTYYKNAIGKTGTSLKSSLHTIISSQSKIDLRPDRATGGAAGVAGGLRARRAGRLSRPTGLLSRLHDVASLFTDA